MWPTPRLMARTKRDHLRNASEHIAAGYRRLLTLQAQGENATEAETEVYTWTVLEKRLQSTRTWPYNTEMLRTFVLTVLTPIALGMSRVAGVLHTSGRPHLLSKMHEEKHAAVGDARHSRPEASPTAVALVLGPHLRVMLVGDSAWEASTTDLG